MQSNWFCAFSNFEVEVLQISEKGIKSISYEDTEHFRLTRQFLNAPDKMFQYLLKK